MYFRIYDGNNVASNWYGPAVSGGDFVQKIPVASAGQYRVEFTDGSNDARSPAPYRFGWELVASP